MLIIGLIVSIVLSILLSFFCCLLCNGCWLHRRRNPHMYESVNENGWYPICCKSFFKYLNYSYLQQFVLISGHYSLSSLDLNDINHNRFYRILFLFFNKRASLSAAATMNCPVSVSNHLYRLPAWLVTVSVVSFYPHQLLYSNRLEIL